jgi:hypothetical protein
VELEGQERKVVHLYLTQSLAQVAVLAQTMFQQVLNLVVMVVRVVVLAQLQAQVWETPLQLHHLKEITVALETVQAQVVVVVQAQ